MIWPGAWLTSTQRAHKFIFSIFLKSNQINSEPKFRRIVCPGGLYCQPLWPPQVFRPLDQAWKNQQYPFWGKENNLKEKKDPSPWTVDATYRDNININPDVYFWIDGFTCVQSMEEGQAGNGGVFYGASSDVLHMDVDLLPINQGQKK